MKTKKATKPAKKSTHGHGRQDRHVTQQGAEPAHRGAVRDDLAAVIENQDSPVDNDSVDGGAHTVAADVRQENRTLQRAREILGKEAPRRYPYKGGDGVSYTDYVFSNGSRFTWNDEHGLIVMLPDPAGKRVEFRAASVLDRVIMDEMRLLMVDLLDLRAIGVDPQKLIARTGFAVADPLDWHEALQAYITGEKPIPASARLKEPNVAQSHGIIGRGWADSLGIPTDHERFVKLASGETVLYSPGDEVDGREIELLGREAGTNIRMEGIYGEKTDHEVARLAVAARILWEINVDVPQVVKKMGPRDVGFVRNALESASQHPFFQDSINTRQPVHPQLGKIVDLRLDGSHLGNMIWFEHGQGIFWGHQPKKNEITLKLPPNGHAIDFHLGGAVKMTLKDAQRIIVAAQSMQASGLDVQAWANKTLGHPASVEELVSRLELKATVINRADTDMRQAIPIRLAGGEDVTGQPHHGLSGVMRAVNDKAII